MFPFSNLIDFMTSGPIVAMELVAEDAVARWRSLIGEPISPTRNNNCITKRSWIERDFMSCLI